MHDVFTQSTHFQKVRLCLYRPVCAIHKILSVSVCVLMSEHVSNGSIGCLGAGSDLHDICIYLTSILQ